MNSSLKHQARKRFGQNFLTNPQVIERIVNSIAPKADDCMVEIGPGLGAITEHLVTQAGTIHAVEIDRDLLQRLTQQFANTPLQLHQADALQFDFASLYHDNPLRIVGNLPYNISTPLLFHLLSCRRVICDMHFMLQEEVVDRLTAVPRTKAYGKLSVLFQQAFAIEKLFTVDPSSFEPIPKVQSAIVRLIPKPPRVTITNPECFKSVVTHCFAHRRKTLRHNLKRLLSTQEMAILGVDIGQRAEELTPDEFAQLSNDVDLILNTKKHIKNDES